MRKFFRRIYFDDLLREKVFFFFSFEAENENVFVTHYCCRFELEREYESFFGKGKF